MPECRTWNNQVKLWQPRFRLDIRKSFLTVSAIGQWDQLLGEVVGSPTLEAFKKKLDSHLSGMGLDPMAFMAPSNSSLLGFCEEVKWQLPHLSVPSRGYVMVKQGRKLLVQISMPEQCPESMQLCGEKARVAMHALTPHGHPGTFQAGLVPCPADYDAS
ncbi:putative UDP-sugar transporter protein SLC35A5 [Varanus komodoensis]|nr:putative UDP-sugar transporter protein SLC35A5 [Varanus komodoensis]